MLNADDWAVPLTSGYRYGKDGPTNCRSCGAFVRWATHETTGKRMPIDPDGVSHFATCPDADRWRKR